jgi:hypothetical protein
MSYQEKRTITSIITGTLVLAAYCIYAFGRDHSVALARGELKFWATSMLIFIGVGIVASIIIQIIFHILLSVSIAVTKKIQDQNCEDKEIERSIGAEMVEDEMDRLIELRSTRVGFILAGIGFVAALVLLALGYSPVVMLNVVFFSFSGGSLLEGFAQLFFYRRGLHNG